MRIIAGQHRGLTLANVGDGDAAAHLRPTPDRVRESLFNVLMGRGLPHGARVLDLFAGTGALGLEALSRGATHVTFVENGRVGQRLITENIAKAKRQADVVLLETDATRLTGAPHQADLIFLDPPYGQGLGQKAIAAARGAGWIADKAIIVWEESAPQPPLPGFTMLDQRRYGTTHITILEAP
ncbi:16S rRNA (guanine(966)-N(2))-methyltransferase RsmD [Octadecabacter sp. G9-8]|uniref:16S rRNA (Guanine(966)-N(2))-methyltransferase RsmD n=1 Tax=Octadecabacter dasysiphoniae TaxID=2909341 RepID=A0ABS9CY39_9RHOB|nr:16S rRNA (guanine(966)-N(2))-methyltransferase RsmD [Octadecabacter dasysiphoniae]MCF2871749.1 16S rRNA (guanine(966)-N(2))-methyltransferase RsmD [Octadecabacter dasysiphoniae]